MAELVFNTDPVPREPIARRMPEEVGASYQTVALADGPETRR